MAMRIDRVEKPVKDHEQAIQRPDWNSVDLSKDNPKVQGTPNKERIPQSNGGSGGSIEFSNPYEKNHSQSNSGSSDFTKFGGGNGAACPAEAKNAGGNNLESATKNGASGGAGKSAETTLPANDRTPNAISKTDPVKQTSSAAEIVKVPERHLPGLHI
jgi:hypothetical protein